MSIDKLRAFISATMPPLDAAMGPLTRLQVLRVLNAMTGLDVGSGESVTDSSARFLEAIQEEQRRGTLILGAMARGMREAAKIQRSGA